MVFVAKFIQDEKWDILGRRKRTILILQDESISFPTLRIVVIMFNSGFRSLSKFEFKCSVIQQRVTVVLE